MKWSDFCTCPKRKGVLPVIGHILEGHGLKPAGGEILSGPPMRKTTIVSSRALFQYRLISEVKVNEYRVPKLKLISL